ncbi:MAG: choice-of-anchor M domain-containing protein [Planctomycetota bacterium]
MKILLYMVLLAAPVCTANNCSLLTQDVTLYFGIETPVPEPDFPVVIDRLHTDFEVSFTSSGWNIVHSYDGNDINLDDGLLYGDTNAYYASVPSGFEFTGAQAGDDIWILPQSFKPQVVYLGMAAEHSSGALCNWNPNDTSKGANYPAQWYQVRLLDVRGPENSDFSLYQTGPLKIFMSTASGGITDDDAYYLTAGSHTHMNWGFTEPGYYEVDFEISTVHSCDSGLTADLWPLGDAYYHGDCHVALHDLAVFSRNWLQTDCSNQPHLCEGADLAEPLDNQVGFDDLVIFADQWIGCGYPGCAL